jgi:hypothetical protein
MEVGSGHGSGVRSRDSYGIPFFNLKTITHPIEWQMVRRVLKKALIVALGLGPFSEMPG